MELFSCFRYSALRRSGARVGGSCDPKHANLQWLVSYCSCNPNVSEGIADISFILLAIVVVSGNFFNAFVDYPCYVCIHFCWCWIPVPTLSLWTVTVSYVEIMTSIPCSSCPVRMLVLKFQSRVFVYIPCCNRNATNPWAESRMQPIAGVMLPPLYDCSAACANRMHPEECCYGHQDCYFSNLIHVAHAPLLNDDITPIGQVA